MRSRLGNGRRSDRVRFGTMRGGLVLRLIYHGVAGLLQSHGTRFLSRSDALVRSRTFTERELTELIESHGLKVNSVRGMPLLPLLFGWLRGRSLIQPSDRNQIPAISDLLHDLALTGTMRRCHVVSAQRHK